MGSEVSSSIRYAPGQPLPAYAYVPGHGLPHPVNDPSGHLYGTQHAEEVFPSAAHFAASPAWLYAIDLFNGGYAWEAHEAWEAFWNALGRTTPEARCVQGLIHLAAAAVKIREGKPEGVSRHTRRACELLGGLKPACFGGEKKTVNEPDCNDKPELRAVLGLSEESLAAVVTELANYTPACWHTSRCPVVRVVASELLTFK